MATNICLRARTQTTNIKLSFTNDRCDLICALQQAELKQGTVLFFSFFYFIWNPGGRLSEADSPAWTGWPTGDRILIWDLVCAWWSSAAIVPPTPTHRCSIKSPDPCVCLCVRDRAAERKRNDSANRVCAQVSCVRSRQKVCTHMWACAVQFVCFPVGLNACNDDWYWQPEGGGLWLSCNNGQSWAECNAKWTAFSPEISHHMSFFENIHVFATTW